MVINGVTIGLARPDVEAVHGPQFSHTGYQREVRGLAPGVYHLVASARSIVTGTAVVSAGVTVTVHANPHMWVDTPGAGATLNQTFAVAGWAIDPAAASGTGVNTVHVWAYPSAGDPIFLGVPSYGAARPDVGAYYGSQFTNSGFNLTASLPPGAYTVVAYAFSTVANTFNQAQSVPVTIATSQALVAIDVPANSSSVGQPFAVNGWAIDLGAPSGPGMDVVHVYAIAQGGAGASTFLGAATYGGARPDVGAYYGSQFTNSGYALTAGGGLAPGSYQINVYAHSTVSGAWTVQSVWVTVQ